MKTVFLDTVGLLALWDSSDQWHDAAVRALDHLGPHVKTVTTSYVMLECANAAARRPYRPLVDQTRQKLEAGGKLIIPSPAEWETAWSEYVKGSAGDASVVDQASFLVMRRLGITDAFTNDRHFKAAGFSTLF